MPKLTLLKFQTRTNTSPVDNISICESCQPVLIVVKPSSVAITPAAFALNHNSKVKSLVGKDDDKLGVMM